MNGLGLPQAPAERVQKAALLPRSVELGGPTKSIHRGLLSQNLVQKRG